MPPFLQEILSQIRAIWGRLDGGQRLTIAAVMFGVIAGLGAIVWYAGRPDYQAVYSSMSADDLHRAQQALLKGNVEYSVDGTSLLVDSRQLAAARRALGSAGMMPGAEGAAESEDEGLGSMTLDHMTRIHKLQRQREKRAEHNLQQMPAVLYAQVSHSKPARSPYRILDPETRSRASVGLKLRPGANFRGVAQVAVREVASALGIPENRITVSDLGGLATFQLEDLGGGSSSSNILSNGDFHTQQSRLTRAKTEKLQALLDRLFPNKAIGSVDVELDPQWQLIKDRSAAENQAKKRVKEQEEKTNRVYGIGQNDPTTTAVLNGTNSRSMASKAEPAELNKTKETEYVEDSLRETTSGQLAPKIAKLSVAVVLDPEVGADLDEAKLVDLIKRTVGWDEERDDEVALTRAPIQEIEVPEFAPPSETMDLVKEYAPIAGQLLGVLLVLFFLRGLLKKSAVPARGSDSRVSVGSRGGATKVAVEEAVEEPVEPNEMAAQMRAEIERAIADDPAAVSKLLESWLQEQGV